MCVKLEATSLKKRRSKSALPVYAFLAVWVLCSLILPLYRPVALVCAAVLAAAAAAVTAAEVRKREPAPEPEPEPAKSYGAEADAVIAEGKAAMAEMARLRESIREERVRVKIDELMRVSDKIVQDAAEDPSDVPQIKKFLTYYLPTTIKLLNAYDRMSDQGIEGENLTRSMQSIEQMLDTAVTAYKKQLDSLFGNQALDIETDISVMNQMLTREGLAGDDELAGLVDKARKAEADAKAAGAVSSPGPQA